MLNGFFGDAYVKYSGVFTEEFLHTFAKKIICHLYCDRGDITGTDWEKIFANCINVSWTAGNKFYDIADVKNSIAYSAKTIKDDGKDIVPLISGRNSPLQDFNRIINPHKDNSLEIGKLIFDIWNNRVNTLKSKFRETKTVVLLRAEDLLSYRMFEFETECYNANSYSWSWSKDGNLRAVDTEGKLRFLWQPKGTQFTIYKNVPHNIAKVSLKNPPVIKEQNILRDLGFNETHYRIYYG